MEGTEVAVMSTAFQIRQPGIHLVGKNQDVMYPNVYLFTNQRGLRKTALMRPPVVPAGWISAYGSLTVSQVGKESPNGGINEAGLVVEQTTLWGTEYPGADDRPALGELAWMQYLLDTCSTVGEALEAALAVRIDQSTSKLHYLLADRSGDRAIVECLQGKCVVHRELGELPILTNTAYAEAAQSSRVGGEKAPSKGDYERNSMERFRIIADRVQTQWDGGRRVDQAYEALAAARREDTVFSLVYDLERMELHAMTARHGERAMIRMADFDFAKEAPAQAADLQRLQAGQQNALFEPYSAAFNLNVVRSFFRDPVLTSVFKWDLPDEMLRFLASYPDSFE
ncbi:linear amide C-N hydrolase [Paenibacillus filicis]|uniref:Linear amide C-N hydrolase n=1 Tax=Paenibacillus filicis TaxID=669464 RepID=A0ABU9DJM3_9BACL